MLSCTSWSNAYIFNTLVTKLSHSSISKYVNSSKVLLFCWLFYVLYYAAWYKLRTAYTNRPLSPLEWTNPVKRNSGSKHWLLMRFVSTQSHGCVSSILINMPQWVRTGPATVRCWQYWAVPWLFHVNCDMFMGIFICQLLLTFVSQAMIIYVTFTVLFRFFFGMFIRTIFWQWVPWNQRVPDHQLLQCCFDLYKNHSSFTHMYLLEI